MYQKNQYTKPATPGIKAADINQENFADIAELVMKNVYEKVTSSQMRPILAKIHRLVSYNKNPKDELTLEELSALQYLKITTVYAAGKDSKTKAFVEASQLLEFIKRIAQSKRRSDLILLGKYYESLIAYHKYYGGRDE